MKQEHPLDGERSTFRRWMERAIYSLMIGLVTLALIVLASILWTAYFNQPPITVKSLDPPDLGTLCPGEGLLIHNRVEINSPIIGFYFVNVMDRTESRGYPNTQKTWVDNLYPHDTVFDQSLVWIVPELEPGRYTRVFAARNSSGNQKTIFTQNDFTIGDDCE